VLDGIGDRLLGVRTITSRVQFSAYWRIGEEPMNVHTSIGIPTLCEISMTGVMSW
jgi:hypothetical protein